MNWLFSRLLHNGHASGASTTWLILSFSVAFLAGAVTTQNRVDFDLQGHRGARGLRPENTIPAFDHALGLGVHTLELDVVVSADSQIVVSHDPVMSRDICSFSDGTPVDREVRLFELTYQEISGYDCGKRGNPRFPEQVRMPASKPLLSDVIAFERQRSAELGRAPAMWNIETKSTAAGDSIMHPGPEVFAGLLYDVLRAGEILDRAVVQSFDPRTLQVMRTIDPGVVLSLLVDRAGVLLVDENLERLGFVPEVYSPSHGPLDAELVRSLKERGMKVLPWTVNDVARMEKLLEMGVDGIITDYPNRALPLLGAD